MWCGIILGVASSFVLWHVGVLDWWQALLLVAGLTGCVLVLLQTRARYVLSILLTVAAPLLLVGTYISIFWIVSGPDTTVPVTITSKEQDIRPGGQYGSGTTYYIIRAVDDDGYSYKVLVGRSEWQRLSEGRETSITYHYERVAGRWLPRQVKTKLGQESVVSGGGRFGTPMEGFNSVMDMLASIVPSAWLVFLYVRYRRKQQVIGWVKMRMRRAILEEPGISHTQLLKSVPGNSSRPSRYARYREGELKELAIKQLFERLEVTCERQGRIRRYYSNTGV